LPPVQELSSRASWPRKRMLRQTRSNSATSHDYACEGAARAACGNDPVVWADSHSGFFYPRFHSDFGKTPHGAFTCYGLAKKADYWSFTPEGDGGRQGREFPLMFCNLCS